MKPVLYYTDYRAYLRDWREERRRLKLPATNRWIAGRMGINSSSWFTDVKNGKKGLSKVTANQLSKVLKHNEREARYFEALVFFNQARTNEERGYYYAEMLALQKGAKVQVLEQEQFEFYSTWYHSVIRSLLGMHPDKQSPKEIAGMVYPPITLSQARKSIDLLAHLGLIQQNNEGVYEPASGAISTGRHTKNLAVEKFQLECMRLAQEALNRFPPENRDISTLTIGISQPTIRKVKDILSEARKKIMDVANNDPLADSVYQVNVQVFPMSKLQDKAGGKK